MPLTQLVILIKQSNTMSTDKSQWIGAPHIWLLLVPNSPSPSHTDPLSSPPLPPHSMPTQVPLQRGFHPSGNRPGLVTHRGDDGLTAHLRERPGPSGKQAQSCIKYKGEKEKTCSTFWLEWRERETGMWFMLCALKPQRWHAASERVHVQGFHSGQFSSLNKVNMTWLFVL